MVRAAFPGSFDPVHFGHIDIALRATRLFDEVVVAVYDRPLKNALFTPEERLDMVNRTFKHNPKIKVMGYSGLTVEFCKQIDAQVVVRGLRVFSDFEYEFRMALANHHLAPEVETIALITSEEHTFLSSTTVREIASLDGDIRAMVSPFVAEALRAKYNDMEQHQKNDAMTSLRD